MSFWRAIKRFFAVRALLAHSREILRQSEAEAELEAERAKTRDALAAATARKDAARAELKRAKETLRLAQETRAALADQSLWPFKQSEPVEVDSTNDRNRLQGVVFACRKEGDHWFVRVLFLSVPFVARPDREFPLECVHSLDIVKRLTELA